MMLSFMQVFSLAGKVVQNSIMASSFQADGGFYVAVAFLLFVPYFVTLDSQGRSIAASCLPSDARRA